jgi:hypothetical protein
MANAKRPKRRFNFDLCHEAGHYILAEQRRREDEGLPHTSLNDIANDWFIEMGKLNGLAEYREPIDVSRFKECGMRYFLPGGDQLEVLARMAQKRK